MKNGMVTSGMRIYAEIFGNSWDQRPGTSAKPTFIPEKAFAWLHDVFVDRTFSRTDIQQRFATLDGIGTIQLLDEQIGKVCSSRIIDGSQALVIILGNLDELYAMGKPMWSELDPDVLLHYHRRSCGSGIRAALCRMFRVEQVGRLGSDHILFPPMGRKAAECLVRDSVRRMTTEISVQVGMSISVSDAVCTRLYKSAALPVLGARPLITAIQGAIPALIGQTLCLLAETGTQSGDIMIDVDDGGVIARFTEPDGTVPVELHWPFPVQPELSPEQIERIAVHEVGHVVAGLVLTSIKPLQACVRSCGNGPEGFVLWDDASYAPFLRSEVLGRLAMLLGGYAAENWYYGEVGTSVGSADDLRKATQLALSLIKEEGFGSHPCFQVEHATERGIGFRGMQEEREREARAWIEQAFVQAQQAFGSEKQLFNALVRTLCTERSLNAVLINDLSIRYGSEERHLCKMVGHQMVRDLVAGVGELEDEEGCL